MKRGSIEREPVDRVMMYGSAAAATIVMTCGLTLAAMHPWSASHQSLPKSTKNPTTTALVAPASNGVGNPLDVASSALSLDR